MNRQDLMLEAGLDEMAALMTRFTAGDGINPTAIRNMTLLRAARPNERVHAVQQPSLCLIAQGAKRAMLGEELYLYDRARYLVASVDLPISGQVVEATPEKPYLCFKLELDPKEIASLLLQADFPASTEGRPARGLFLSKTSLRWWRRSCA